jgi:5-formyltetrahydrofolate cyclo-ligase
MIDMTRRRVGEAPQQGADVAQAEPAERTVQELPRRDAAFYRKRQGEPAPDQIMNHASSVLQRVAVASVSEIESLIVELEQLRDFLRQESVRIQREIEGYARLSEEATKSTKIIAESVAQWKNALEHVASRRV